MICIYHKIILRKVTILEKTVILTNVKDTEVREFVINDRLKYSIMDFRYDFKNDNGKDE